MTMALNIHTNTQTHRERQHGFLLIVEGFESSPLDPWQSANPLDAEHGTIEAEGMCNLRHQGAYLHSNKRHWQSW